MKNERAQTYSDLIVHPRRGILLWLDYNAEHPNGVVMVSGMDGRKVTTVFEFCWCIKFFVEFSNESLEE